MAWEMVGEEEGTGAWCKVSICATRASIPNSLGIEEGDCSLWEGYEERSIPGQSANSGYWEGTWYPWEEKARMEVRRLSNSFFWRST